jgi:hypothetical protein
MREHRFTREWDAGTLAKWVEQKKDNARSKERRADVLDQFDNVIRLMCSAANMIAKWVWRVRAIVVTKDQSGDRKTISRPVSETESKLAQIRNANQWASERKSH